eukprot:scaffold51198_cov36-Phaeocystis_antarctica.AAC.1
MLGAICAPATDLPNVVNEKCELSTSQDHPSKAAGLIRGMPGAPFGSTKSASSHTQHPTGHVAIMATGLSSPVNERFAASSTARQQDRLTQRAHTR